jgi:carnitine-CoA ligase
MTHTMPDNILAGLIANRAATTPDLDVVTFEGAQVRPDEARTYRTLWRNGLRLARGLLDRGLRPGDHFALLMANHPEFLDAMVAASITGTVFVPIDPRAKGDKLAFMLDNAACKGVVAADYALDNLLAVRGACKNLAWIIGLATDEAQHPLSAYPGIVPYDIATQTEISPADFHPQDPDGAMQLIFTSGTTGDPKGIVMTHGRYYETSAAAARLFGYLPNDRPYSGLSLTHANAQIVTIGASLVLGLRAVLSRRFTKSRLWDITRRYGCTTFTLLGGMTNSVYSEPPKPNDADNPVRFVVSAGMPKAIWGDFETRFNVKVLEFYGAAEGGLTAKPIGVGPIGSIGKPVPTLKYRIVDAMDNDCLPGAPGELLLRHADGAPFKVEYFGNAAASTAKCKDGWLRTGDVVREDADGWLFFEYRMGGGLRHNGEFINPAAIEKSIAECGLVDDVFVYGIGAASGAPGESDVVAAVVPKDGVSFDPYAVFRACSARLDANAVPSYLQIVQEIPKTASEKPQQRFLVEMFARQPQSVFAKQAVAAHATEAS